MAAPWLIPYVKAACDQARLWYDAHKFGKSRMAIGNCIRLMSRALKSREGDHFQVAADLAAQLEGYIPEIPDWANDHHTIAGKQMRRRLEFFRAESTKLTPPPVQPDQYQAECHRLWALSDGRRRIDEDD